MPRIPTDEWVPKLLNQYLKGVARREKLSRQANLKLEGKKHYDLSRKRNAYYIRNESEGYPETRVYRVVERNGISKELMPIYRMDPSQLRVRRNLTIISQVTMGEITFIMTKDLYQYVQIGDRIYDMNTRFLEFARRIYDYAGLGIIILNEDASELRLFRKIMEFKYGLLFANWPYKPRKLQKETTLNHFVMDKASKIEDSVMIATRKYLENYPEAFNNYLQPTEEHKNDYDWTELPNSEAVRRYMKGAPFITSNVFGRMKKGYIKDLEEKDNVEMDPVEIY